jgi:hypothetical protein
MSLSLFRTPVWDTTSGTGLSTSLATTINPTKVKIALTLAQARSELGVDELRKSVADAAQIATESVKKYLKKYLEHLQENVSEAEKAALNTYDEAFKKETEYPEVVGGKIKAYTDAELETLVLDAYKNTYQTSMKMLNMRMPMGDKIQTKYLNQFSVGVKLK